MSEDPKKSTQSPPEQRHGQVLISTDMVAAAEVNAAASGNVLFQEVGAFAAAGEIIAKTVDLLLQTVIVPGERTSEGRLIEAVALPWFDIIALLEKDPSAAYQILWEKWEEIIAGAYKKAQFDEVTLTPR